ncbi:NADH-FMN oxidoreductase RutF, flavin reductase (DIM6/NTAB) family [Fodinibius roseus]|uniref:NADH-FMN oxidoreductase RutF, flavin reductase (DIM6/NTAB) family n=1 Tax=Fodinibius roseus TaxID=1194090 RepID=A0A1M4X7C8_9BACT|nr:flavin reductase [Fodinibius roseus]SHE89394.1 NADH-FMN oxidoreductase RutF, flavin reductase (DIM6/NTAB) family [Fodinibius roseus]
MADQSSSPMIDITDNPNLWTRFFMVHALLIIGSKEKDGSFNMAPKHMAMPLGFGPYFGFIGTPRKTTYRNIKREEVFTVSFPQPDQLVQTSLAASPREDDDSKPVIEAIPTVKAQIIEGVFMENSYLQLECTLHEIMGKFGEWEIIVGEIVAAYVHEDALRKEGEDSRDNKIINDSPLLAYLHPNRFSIIKKSHNFPLPKDFKR